MRVDRHNLMLCAVVPRAVSREQALSRFLMYDAHGTLVGSRQTPALCLLLCARPRSWSVCSVQGAGRPGITAAQAPFVRPDIKVGPAHRNCRLSG